MTSCNYEYDIFKSQPEQQPSFDFAAAQSRIDQLNQEIVSSQANLKAHFDAIPMLRDVCFSLYIMNSFVYVRLNLQQPLPMQRHRKLHRIWKELG